MVDFYLSPPVNSSRMNKCRKTNVSDLTEVLIIFTLWLNFAHLRFIANSITNMSRSVKMEEPCISHPWYQKYV